MPLYSVLCLHKSEVRQIALECVNQRFWAGTRTRTRTRTSKRGHGYEGGTGSVLNQLQLGTLRWLFLCCWLCCWSGFWQNRLYWFHAGKIKKWTCGNLHT